MFNIWAYILFSYTYLISYTDIENIVQYVYNIQKNMYTPGGGRSP